MMIKTPLSTVIGGAFWTPSCTILGGTSKTFNQLIKPLFANNEQGFAYDPNDLSTMYQDAAGTVPVTAVGQPVGLILDKSGRNNHAYQTTSASRPILRQNAVTGAYYLEFDGSDDFLVTNSIDFTATDKISLFAGVRKLSDASTSVIAELGTSAEIGSNNGTFAIKAPTASGLATYGGTLNGTTPRQFIASGFAAPHSTVLTSQLTVTAAAFLDAVKLRINGVQQTFAGAGAWSTRTSFNNYQLYIGRRGGAALPFNGHIYSLICVGRLTSENETAAIEKELAKRVGVTLS